MTSSLFLVEARIKNESIDRQRNLTKTTEKLRSDLCAAELLRSDRPTVCPAVEPLDVQHRRASGADEGHSQPRQPQLLLAPDRIETRQLITHLSTRYEDSTAIY